LTVTEHKMAKEKSKPEKKEVSKLTKAEELGPGAFVSQKDYEEQVALEKELEEKPEEKTE